MWSLRQNARELALVSILPSLAMKERGREGPDLNSLGSLGEQPIPVAVAGAAQKEQTATLAAGILHSKNLHHYNQTWH
jgi:hypothetical protein